MKPIGYDMHAGRSAMPASIEIAPRQALESRDLPGLFPPGTKTYLCDVGVDPVKEFVRAVRRVRDLGYEPVPHIPARRMRSKAELRDRVQAYAEEGGASDVLVVGGGLTRPAGPYSSTMEVLSTGILDRYGFRDIGVAGHPEGTPDFSADTASEALRLKRDFARRSDARLRIVTQFGFDAAVYLQWAESVRAAGIDLPIHLGVAGPAKIATLIRFAALCGIGNSVSVLKKRPSALAALATSHSPESVAGPIERHWSETPDTRVRQLHVFPFGGLAASAQWLYGRGSWMDATAIQTVAGTRQHA